MQNCLVEVLRSAHSYQGASSVERWTDRICVRTAMRLGAGRRHRESKIDDGAEPDNQVDGRTLDDRVSSVSVVGRALATLTEPRRTAIVLRHVFDYSVGEIAELCGVSVNTIKERLVRAREQMRRTVREDEVVGRAPLRLLR